MSRGNAGAAQYVGSEAHRAPEVDFGIVFERSSSACLLLLPEAPGFAVVAVSDAYLALTRARRADSVGLGLFDALQQGPVPLRGGQIEALRGGLEQAMATLAPTQLLLEVVPAEARARAAPAPAEPTIWSVMNTPVLSADGSVRYLLLRLELVGAAPPESGEFERRRGLEQLLAQRTRDLDNALAELDAFSYSVSHDLRAPLRAIDGFSQALSQDYAGVLDERAQHYLERVRSGAQRMSALIDDMLELSRTQRAPLRRTQVDVSVLAQRTVDALRKASPERQVEVDVSPGLTAHADSHLLGVVLEELLENAWKFTSKKPAARIRVGVESSGTEAALFVADDGAGFDMAYASRLFSPFQRMHKATDFAGTGIGLAVVHRILSRHGGRIWAEAEVGKGAKFCFTWGAADE